MNKPTRERLADAIALTRAVVNRDTDGAVLMLATYDSDRFGELAFAATYIAASFAVLHATESGHHPDCLFEDTLRVLDDIR